LCRANFVNNVIFGNRAGYDGDAFASCNGAIINNTLYLPDGAVSNGALWACQGTIRNNIIVDSYPYSESSTPTYCRLAPGWGGGGEGNINANPRMVDPENGDFRLRPDSPCIDAGGWVEDVLADHEGKARPVRGVNVERGDGSLYDIGAFEFHLFDNYLSDIDGNLKVNHLDLFEFEPAWHKETDFAGDPRNLNGDSAIDAFDLLVLRNDWGVETGVE